MQREAFYILEDGTTFRGKLFGHEDETMGEAVFNTSMSGYEEIITDPSYRGQMVAMTYPMIGNYGITGEDGESNRVQVAGLVVKEYCKSHSNYRATSSLDEYLKKEKITAIEGVDTRKLTKHIRDRGAMRAGIFLSPQGAVEKLQACPKMAGLDLASEVSCNEKYVHEEDQEGNARIAVYDFGVKKNILRLLKASGFNITVYPSKTPLKEVLEDGARGIFLSNGPGDPDAVTYAKDLVKDIVREKIPCFGICLGHQIISLGLGARTYKLKFGHRGGNHPVKNLKNNRVEITSQNHGFAVDLESIENNDMIELTHIDLNDNTVEGIRHRELPIFSVQHHPEAAPGPRDSLYLFEEFKKLVHPSSP